MKKIIVLVIAILAINIAEAQWLQTNLDSISIQVLAANGNSIFAGTAYNGVLLSADNGDNWTAIDSGLTSHSVTVLAIKDSNIFAGTKDSGVYFSSNYGSSWVAVHNGINRAYVHAFAINGNNIFEGNDANNGYHGVYLSTNNGSSWSKKDTGLFNYPVYSLALYNNSIIAGTNHGVFKSSNDGNSWDSINSTIETTAILSLAISGSNIYAGTFLSGVLLSSNNGNSWNVLNNGLPAAPILAINIIGNCMFAGTNNNGVYLSTDNGSSWVADGLQNLTVRSFAVNDNYIFAATSSGVWKLPLVSDSIVQYMITTSANPTIGGIASGGGVFRNDSACTVKATSNSNYTFLNWTENGSIVSFDSIYTFIVTANRNLVANFALSTTQYTITTSANPTNGGNTTGGGTITVNQSCTVKAIPNTGYFFINWTENGFVSSDSIYTFNVNANRNLVANFNMSQYFITTAASPVIGGSTTGGGIFNYNSTCTVKAYPSTGYAFVNWTENSNTVSTDTSYSFVVTALRSLVANFTIIDGIDISSQNDSFHFYPNPAKEILTIETNLNTEQRIEIINLVGQIIYTNIINKKTMVDISAYANGIYILKLSSDKGIVVKKFVKE